MPPALHVMPDEATVEHNWKCGIYCSYSVGALPSLTSVCCNKVSIIKMSLHAACPWHDYSLAAPSAASDFRTTAAHPNALQAAVHPHGLHPLAEHRKISPAKLVHCCVEVLRTERRWPRGQGSSMHLVRWQLPDPQRCRAQLAPLTIRALSPRCLTTIHR